MKSARLAQYRFDLGRKIGMGHLRRSEALGVELAARGWKNEAWCRGFEPGEEPLRDLAIDRSFPTLTEEPRGRASLVFVDSYLFPPEESLKQDGAWLACYHDWPQKSPADLVIDLNYGAEPAEYAAAGCRGRVLAGPDYFPVRLGLVAGAPESRRRDRGGKVGRLLVTFGGSFWHTMAGRAAEELVAAGKAGMEIRIVAGDLAGASPELRSALAAIPNAALVPPGSELAGHFAWADMAVSAAGLTKYELALYGVPAIILSVADNQDAVATKFAAAGTARFLGRAEKLARGALSDAILALAADGAERRRLAAAGMRLVDGRGAARIADEIEKLVEGRS